MWEPSEKGNSAPLPALGDFDVEQCVEEMFHHLASAPGGGIVPAPAEMQARCNPMVATRAPEALSPLPATLREELLELCAEIVAATKSRPLQTLMISGIEAGVGASFVAKNLCRVLAEFKQLRVALLTVVREPLPVAGGARGGRNALTRRGFDYFLVRTERPNFMEIASAQGAVTLTELLGNAAASMTLPYLKQEFDFIVVDTPAVALHAEVALLAALMDGVILVAEQHATSLRKMDQAYDRLGKVQAHVLGIILNRQKRI